MLQQRFRGIGIACRRRRLCCRERASSLAGRVGVSSTARSRNAAAAATPPRACARLAERSSSAATSSSGAGVARARCQARRSGSVSRVGGLGERAMDAVAVVGGGRAVGGGSDEWVRELDAPADRSAARRRPPGRPRSVRARGSGSGAVEQHGVAQWLRGRGEDEQLRVGREQQEAPDVALLDLARRSVGLSGSPNPPARSAARPRSRQLEQRERVAVALRDDLLADGRVQRAVHVLEQQRARVAVAESVDRQVGQPGEESSSPLPVRAAHTIATRSASRRRATKPRTCAEAWSSHCASSTMQTSGCRSATSANSVSVASPTRNRSGAGPALRPNTVASASRCGAGQPVE